MVRFACLIMIPQKGGIPLVSVTDNPAPDVLTAEFVNVGAIVGIVEVTVPELLPAALLGGNLFSVV